jgi:hypothetical protein
LQFVVLPLIVLGFTKFFDPLSFGPALIDTYAVVLFDAGSIHPPVFGLLEYILSR